MSARSLLHRRTTALLAPVAAVMIAAGALGISQAGATTAASHGPNEFGMTMGDFRGDHVGFTYTHGFWCDKSVTAQSTSGCEVGAKWNVAPSTQHDPLYITVPLGFTVNHQMDCPDHLTCVDHPATLDLTRLAGALAPLFKTTPDALLPALRNFRTPGHDHFIADLNEGKAEWWDVYVVGVTDRATYDDIQVHQSYSYLKSLITAKNPHVVGPIPTNLFLFFRSV
ncbi:MAG TPA: hypothetical protein VFL59_10980 [Candidatus Nanopelagicales bacterium]|nr:hypothetical protein [Candidatus Nanopelagicales bacterium]